MSPIPTVRERERSRTKKGRWRKKRSDVGESRKEQSHEHKWYVDLIGIQFLQCDCGETKAVEIQRKKVYIQIIDG